MTPLEEAHELSRRVSDALVLMRRLDDFKDVIKESEVRFRYEAIVGMLIMAQNDILNMVQAWEWPTPPDQE